jgi:hypothetical protein
VLNIYYSTFFVTNLINHFAFYYFQSRLIVSAKFTLILTSLHVAYEYEWRVPMLTAQRQVVN